MGVRGGRRRWLNRTTPRALREREIQRATRSIVRAAVSARGASLRYQWSHRTLSERRAHEPASPLDEHRERYSHDTP